MRRRIVFFFFFLSFLLIVFIVILFRTTIFQKVRNIWILLSCNNCNGQTHRAKFKFLVKKRKRKYNFKFNFDNGIRQIYRIEIKLKFNLSHGTLKLII